MLTAPSQLNKPLSRQRPWLHQRELRLAHARASLCAPLVTVEADNRDIVLALREIDRGLAPLMSWWALFVASTASSKWLGTFLRQSSTVLRAIGFRLSVYRSRQKLILDVRTYVNSDIEYDLKRTELRSLHEQFT